MSSIVLQLNYLGQVFCYLFKSSFIIYVTSFHTCTCSPYVKSHKKYAMSFMALYGNVDSFVYYFQVL